MSLCLPAHPYLKWAGSKRKLVADIVATLPHGFRPRRLIEPFVGSGAVALALPVEQALLADINVDLIAAHRLVIADPAGFVDRLHRLFVPDNNTAEAFLRLRAEFNASADPVRRAELFVYLNRHCFNGLVRFSKAGQFNTPFGRMAHPYLPAQEIHEFARRLRHASLKVADFQEVMEEAGEGDFVYCDPPYLPLTSWANFSAYAAGGFSMAAHEALASAAKEAAERGALVVISNHDTPLARTYYEDATEIRRLQVLRSISCKGEGRGKAPELLAIYRPDGQNLPVVCFESPAWLQAACAKTPSTISLDRN